MQKLYDVVFTDNKEKEQLYYKSNGKAVLGAEGLTVEAGGEVDLLTYFNCFSICKWKEYTTIKGIAICGEIKGKGELEIYSIGKGGKTIASFAVAGSFSQELSADKLQGEILGIRLRCQEASVVKNLQYQGAFEKWQEQKIGVSICTFKREQYVKVTMQKLLQFREKHPWLSVLVVDNGATLEECDTDALRVIYNPNYGGSGGFTRGLMENLRTKANDYVLLMDDDIDLETSALEHMYSILCGLKDSYRDSFLSGAMLRMQNPCIQHENTAYWGKIRLHSLGQGWDLTQQKVLLDNEHISDCINQYGAWWYCCIPIKRIEELGMPLPVFVKGDDIEYGLRNERKVIHLNGIGVWHEAFEGKQSLWVDYFAYRNFFIVNHFAKGCSKWTLIAMTCGRLAVHFVKGHFDETKALCMALQDAIGGFEKITEVPADVKLQEVRAFKGEGSYIVAVLKVLGIALYCLFNYDTLNKQYRSFKRDKLQDESFWIEYLSKGTISKG